MKWYLLVLKKYAVFQGRARRKEYWYFFLFNLLFAYAVLFFSIWIKLPSLYLIYVLASLIPGLAVGVRRMHDVNKSGWFILIPIYNLILCCTDGTRVRINMEKMQKDRSLRVFAGGRAFTSLAKFLAYAIICKRERNKENAT